MFLNRSKAKLNHSNFTILKAKHQYVILYVGESFEWRLAMHNKQTLPSKKQTICIIIFMLTSSLACNYPDVYKMVYDDYFGPGDTKEAQDRNLKGTENARMDTRLAEQNTLHAEENNKQMTVDAIKQTENSVIMTQTQISNRLTSVAIGKEFDLTSTAYSVATAVAAETQAVERPNPVIDSVRFPPTITTGKLAIGWIDFHDYNGDVNRVRIEAVQAEGWSTMEFYPSIIKGDNTRGTIEFSFT
jgi:ribosomal protein L18